MKLSLFLLPGSLAIAAVAATPAAAGKCFASKGELQSAVDRYIDDGCAANDGACEAGRTYGRSINSWCVGNVADMAGLFLDKRDFNEDISAWDVSSVSTMRRMFYQAYQFNGVIGTWDVSSVSDMSDMFAGTSVFNQDLNSWDVSRVTNMKYMFNFARSFNGNIAKWDISSVTNMQGMFSETRAFDSDISSWETSNVVDMGRLFRNANVFNGAISSWDTSNVRSMNNMFYGASSFNRDISPWNTSSATTMIAMLSGASAFNGDIHTWDVSSVTNMKEMFKGATLFNQDLCSWGDTFPYTKSDNIFVGSGCVFQETPQFLRRRPFCASSCTTTTTTAATTAATTTTATTTIASTPSSSSADTACLTEEDCAATASRMGMGFSPGLFSTSGCFSKKNKAYFSLGTINEMTKANLPGVQERIYCDGEAVAGLPVTEDEITACLTESQCDKARKGENIDEFLTGDFPTHGCFKKKGKAFWGIGGSREEVSEKDLPGVQDRIYCRSIGKRSSVALSKASAESEIAVSGASVASLGLSIMFVATTFNFIR